MSSSISIQDQVRAFVVSNFLFDTGEVADDVSLTEEGVIDSTGVLELVAFVEESFEVRVEDSELLPENFDSIARLTLYIERKANERMAAAG